jgi:hypothetical protein
MIRVANARVGCRDDVRGGDELRVVRFRPVERAPNDRLTPEALLAERVSEVGKLAEIRFRLGAHEEVLRRLAGLFVEVGIDTPPDNIARQCLGAKP